MIDKHSHTNNLLFLIAAAPMGMGCIIVTDDGDDTTGADTGTNQTTGSQTSDGTAGTETGMATGGATGTGESSSGTDSGGADSTATAADSTSGGGSSVCADYAAIFVECMLPYGEYVEDTCNYNLAYLEMYSAACGMAYADFIGCLSALSCEEFGGDAPCSAELDAFLALNCPTAE